MRIPLGLFEPDKSKFNGSAIGYCVNAQPVANGWGPMPDLSVISAALATECRGAVYILTSDGVFTIIAATATAIYKLDPTDFSWDDISGTSAPYTLGVGDEWSFTVFGSQLVIHNIADPIQVYDIEAGGTCADLAGSPPKAKYSWVSGDFLVLGYLEGTDGDKKVRWSAVNDIESWTIGTNAADEQLIPEGNEVMAGFGTPEGFYVISRSAMNYFQFYPTSGFTFVRQVINPKYGAVAPRSVVSVGPGQFFYLAEEGFFAGAERRPIGAERVDNWFFEQIDEAYLSDVQGAADPFAKIVWWNYRRASGTYHRIGYDWQLDRWCSSDLDVGLLIPLVTPGMTWDSLDTLYATIDDVTPPFDSRLFVGGRPTLATFNSDNKLAFFSGASLQAEIDTSIIEPDAEYRTFLSEARVISDAPISGISVTDTTYDYHGADGVESLPSTPNRAGLCNFRQDGRLHRQRVTFAAGLQWSIASDIEAKFQRTGKQ